MKPIRSSYPTVMQWLSQRHGAVAWLALVLGLALSVVLTVGVRQQVEQEARHQFEANARDVLYRVQTEIGSYEEVLVGLSAFLGSKEMVSRAEFRRYVEGLDLGRRFPGFENLNYAQIVPAGELRRFEGRYAASPWADVRDGRWYASADETLVELTAALHVQAARSRAIVESRDLADPGKPSDRWDGPGPATLERILLHLIQEYARHLGHLDIAAELADGRVGE